MQIDPLPQGFGANVTGFDLQQGRDPDDVAALQRAFDEHHLLVFRGREPIAPERHVEIMSWFGPIGANGDGQGNNWTVLHNDEPAGSAVLPFHCDISYMEHPIEGISLHPVALPEAPTSTTYVSNARAWDALPEELKAKLRGRKARHYYDSGKQLHFDWPTFEHWHPACMTHPCTARELLFVTEHHTDRVEGMSEAEAAEVLAACFAELYAPAHRYEHVWRVGDLVAWDNRAVQHARTRAAVRAQGERCLQRVATGEHGFLEQLEGLQRRLAEEAA